MKKWILVPLLILAVGVTMSGCASRAATSATTAPTMKATTAPTNAPEPIATMEATASPDAAGSATAGSATMMPEGSTAASSMTPAEAGRMAERIAEAVERLSEVDDAEVVVSDNRVLVAVEFDDQYRAGLDDRMKKMTTETVQEIDETLTDVRITDDGTLYGQVKGLGERLAKATGLDELADDFGDLWDRMMGQ